MTETARAGKPVTSGNLHKEGMLERHLVERLVAEQGYLERSPEQHDRALALDRELLRRFLRGTQPAEWESWIRSSPAQPRRSSSSSSKRA